MTRKFHQILDGLWQAWGIRPAPSRPSARKLGVYLPRPEGSKILIGHLSFEDAEYVFRYASTFRASGLPPVPDFPDLEREYRARRLWPFFADRIPPTEREDVRQVVEERRIDTSDYLGLLAALGSKTAVSPYVLEQSPA